MFQNRVFRILIGIGFLYLVHANSVRACELTSESSWYWSPEKLIDQSRNILLVKITESASDPLDPGFYRYRARILEPIRSSDYEKYARGKFVELKKMAAPEFQTSTPNMGRATHTKDCKILAGFRKGKSYLLFLDSFHPRGYEEVLDPHTDAWYKKVSAVFAGGLQWNGIRPLPPTEKAGESERKCSHDTDCEARESYREPHGDRPGMTLLSCYSKNAIVPGSRPSDEATSRSKCFCRAEHCSLK